MRTIKSIFLITLVSIITTSCTSNDIELEPVVVKQALNIHAPVTTDYKVSPPVEAGLFTKFSFEKGAVVTDDNWDIAFRGTTIIVNGGAKVGLTEEPTRNGVGALSLQTGKFIDVLLAPNDTEFAQDQSGALALSKSTWYSYNPQNHLISPVSGKVLVIKTSKGHYAKMEILSYYKDMDSSNSADPVNSGSGYYSFNYVYNPNLGDKNIK
jgi:hypothetical protein